MKILLVGGGGREHALAWKISQSPLCETLICAPGNAGIAQHARCEPIQAHNITSLVDLAKNESIDLVIIGPEAPLVMGLADKLRESGIATFGPGMKAAQLEGSKGFMKDFCKRHAIPTAAYRRFSAGDAVAAKAFAAASHFPMVIKADGLAAGKGVSIVQTFPEAEKAIDEAMVKGQFGEAGTSLVIEEYLEGEECSFFVLCDGENVLPLIAAQDHKRVGEGDTGANTGGMGAYSPAPIFTDEIQEKAMREIIMPTLDGLKMEGIDFKGVFFAGLMICDGEPLLLEYNVRFGDPECQVLMRRLESDIVPALAACAKGGLADIKLEWSQDTALTVVMAAEGYPGSYRNGTVIRNLEHVDGVNGVTVFHAATKRGTDNRLEAHGGRVLGVTAKADTIKEAQFIAYHAIEAIDWPDGFCRADIGWRALDK